MHLASSCGGDITQWPMRPTSTPYFSQRIGFTFDRIDDETKKNFETVIDYIMAQ